MTDDLRTRIAAITASLIREEIDIDPVWLVAQHVADAVIRELGPLVRYWDANFNEVPPPEVDTDTVEWETD